MAADTIPFPQTQIAQREIAFIDTSVSGYRAIVDGIRPGVDICLIDGAHDGLAQIAAALEGRHDIAAVHIFSHGESGALQLGSTRLSLDNMGDYAADLAVVRAAMAPGGDLMVYGCDVAAGDAGQAFVNALAHATGADVAASANLTGSVLQHGDWVLDTQTGPIEAAVALGAAGQQAFAGVLAIGSENFDSLGLITNTSPNEMLAGNWKFTTAVDTDMAVANSDPGEFAVYLNEDGPTGDRAVILNYNFSPGVTQYTMGSADGSNFQLSSFAIGQIPGVSTSVVTITAYSNGIQVAGPQSVDLSTSNTYGDITYTMVHDDGGGRAGSLSFDSAYADIDEIDFSFASDANLAIDDIVATPVSADTTGPVFSSATVNGSTLVMTYTDASALDATNVPGTGSFAVTAGGNAVTVDTAVVNASARTVTLTLHGPVANNQAVTVAYTDPSAGNDASAIQDALGNDAASLTPTTVTNLTPDTTPPVFASASVDGTTLVLSYTEANTLDAAHGPLPGAFTVMAAGTPVPVSAVSVDAAGKTVTLTLSTAVLYSQAVTVAYGDPTGANDANAIQDAAGNDAASLSATSVTNNTADTTPPSVSGNIAVPANGTYVAGQALNFTVTFDENVVVTGTDSTLGLTIGGTTRSATFASSTANSITYTYTVQAGDADADGIAVGTITPGTSTIRDAAGNDASLTLSGHVPATTGILVDTIAPAVAGNVNVPANGTYVAGQNLDFTVTFDENVAVTGSDSTLGLTIGATAHNAGFLSSSGNTVTYRYTVQAGDTDADGITVGAISPGTSTIRDTAGNDASLTLSGHVPSTAGVLVDATVPSVAGNIAVPANGTYVAGQTLNFTVTFDENVTVTGTDSTLGLTIGGTARSATFASSTGNTVTYTYTVQAGDADADGIALGAISPGTSTIRDAAGNDANLTLSGHVPATTGVLVDAVAPAVAGNIGVPANATYVAGQTLSFTVTFDENVTVTGTDSTLGLTIGGTTRSATFASSTANSITYTYTVQAGDADADGIAVGTITPGTSTIRDAAGNDASLTLSGHVPATTGILVDTIAPTVAGNVSVPANGTYVAGQNLDFTVTFDENVAVTGSDSTLGVTIGTTAHNAGFLSSSGNTVTYRYTVQAGDTDADGITLGAISPGTSTIRDAAGNDASLTLSGHVPSTAGVLVDATVPSVAGNIAVPANATYVAGQTLNFTVTFDENVTVAGTDSTLGLTIGDTTRSATFASSTGNTVTYTYTVQAGDADADGIALGAISPGTSTIRDAAGNDANLTLSGHVPATTGVLVDAVAPAVAGNIGVPANATYVAGQALNFTVTFDENVVVTGTDSTLGLTIGGTTRSATFASSTANSITYTYTVQAGDADADGIAVGTITPGTSTIRDAAGNDATLTLSGHVPATTGILVDTIAPAVGGNVSVPANGTYVAGQNLDFTVTFDENVVVTGSDSTLGVTIGATAHNAGFLSSSGNTVTYRYTVQAGDTDADGITLGAITPGTSTIRDAAGNDASLTLSGHVPSTAGVLVDATVPSVAGNIAVPANGTYVAGQTLNFTVTFDENVTVTGTDSTLGLTIGGTARSATFASSTGNTVTYTYTVQAGDADADGIALGAISPGTSTIRDAAGNDANLTLSGHVPATTGVLVDAVAPAVAGNIGVPANATYVAGQALNFTVTFDENVVVTGTDSTLGLTIGGTTRSATFASSTANSITYTYTVQAGDADADGIAVGTITPGTSTIRDAAGNDATLTLSGHVPATTGILVDTIAPAVGGNVSVPANGTYVAGQNLDFTVTFDENVVVTGSDSTLGVTIGATAHNAGFLSSSGNTVTYRYTVQAGDTDADGITLGAITPGTSTIRDAAGNDASLTLSGHVPSTAGVLVDATVPSVAGNIAVPANGTYVAGQTLNFTVTFDENVTVTGTDSTLGLTIGDTTRSATFASSTGNTVTYTYTVQAGDADADGIALGAISPGTSTIRDAAGNDANLTLSGHVPATTGVLVDAVAPAVAGNIGVPANGTYVAGQTLSFTVTFDENVTVTGTDSTLGLTIGGTTRSATFASGTANSITYTYTVQAGDADADGIAVGTITPGTSTIRDAAGNDATLTLSGHVPATTGILVDTIAPAVAGNVNVPANGTYVAGQNLDFTVTFDENVVITGSDSTLGVTIGATAHNAGFLSSSGNTVIYRYTVQAGDTDADGITLGAISPGTSTIRDAAGNDASLTLSGHVPSTAGVLVDATVPSVAGNIAVPANATYVAGQTLNFTVTFDENVTVAGTDSTLGLTIGGTTRSATFASSTGNTVTYTYTVQAGDADADGIALGAISPGTSTIRDAAGNNANLTLSGHVPATTGVLVDAVAPAFLGASVNGATLVMTYADTGLLDATHVPGAGDFTVTASGRAVSVTAIVVDAAAHTVTLSLASPVANGAAVTVAYGDPGDANDVNAIQDAAGNDAASLGATSVVNNTPAPTAPAQPTVDGVVVQVGTVVNSDGSVSQALSIPIVTAGRVDQVGDNTVADIPLVHGADGSALLTTQVPVGIGLQATGSAQPKAAGDSLTDLIREIQAHTAAGSHDQGMLTGGGSGFLGDLASDAPLIVQTIVPIAATGGVTPGPDHLAINGTAASAGSPATAIVLDARGLPAGTSIELNNVEFVALIGAVSVSGGAGEQNVWGDSASQTIYLGPGDDVLHGGGGNDIVGSAGGNDQIFGDDGDDVVFGGAGNDTIDGGTGHDTLQLAGANRSDYSMRVAGGKLVVTQLNDGPDGADVVTNVEALHFTGATGDTSAYGTAGRLVQALTGHPAGLETLDAATAASGKGASLSQIAHSLYDQSGDSGMSDAAFVQALYQNALHRTAGVDETAFWTGKLDAGTHRADVALAVADSAEMLAIAPADTDFNATDVATLVRMYSALFDRAPDEAGLNYWIGAHENGMAMTGIANAFVMSAESSGQYSGMDDVRFVDTLYETALHREPVGNEAQYWIDSLAGGRADRGDVLLAFADSAEKVALIGTISTSIPTL